MIAVMFVVVVIAVLPAIRRLSTVTIACACPICRPVSAGRCVLLILSIDS